MKRGVRLPIGTAEAGRSSNAHHYRRIAACMLLTQAFALPASSEETIPHQPQKDPVAACEKVGSLCTLSRILEMDLPVSIEAMIATPAHIVIAPANLEATAATAEAPPVSCSAAVRHVVRDLGQDAVAGWDVECRPGGYKCMVKGTLKDCDGEAKLKERKVIIAPDANDSTARRYFIVAHELGHVADAKSGMWTGPALDCAIAPPEAYCYDELEQRADAFAHAHGYYDQ